MSEARIVIDYIQEQKGINLDTLIDKDFSQFSWLNERESVFNEEGERVSKSYYYENKREAIRIEYSKIIGDFIFDGITYPNIFLGFKKTILWLRWDGTIGRSKNKQPYYFNLQPIYDIDNPTLILDFSSKKQKQTISEERINSIKLIALDNDLSAKILQTHKQAGEIELRKIWNKIQRLKDNGQLTANQFRTVSEVLFDALIPLEFGMWQVAQTKVNATTTASGIIGTIRTQVKAIIDDYVTANY